MKLHIIIPLQTFNTFMPFIHGTLAFVHWYSGAFIESIELLGIFILSRYKENIRPAISLIEEDGMTDKLDVLHFLKEECIF